LSDIALLFLRLGVTAFGGPAAHIAMMEDEVVRRRGWLTRDQFLDYLGGTNLIPGPNSTEVAMHIGHARAGWRGLVVAGVSFIAPATLIVGGLAWAYVKYGGLPEVTGILYGIKPVVIAIVAQALWGLSRSAVKTRELAVLAGAAAIAAAAGMHELVVLLAAGSACVLLRMMPRPGRSLTIAALTAAAGASTTSVLLMAVSTVTTTAAPFGLSTLFLVCGKIGSVLFGSGYVLLAFLRADFVERLRWLTEQQLLDAVAAGQVTPGPISTTVTFVGYLLAGPAGAATATVGFFLPAFVFVALSGPLVPRLRRSPTASAAFDGVNVASLALMAVVSWQLGRAALVDRLTVVIAGIALFALVRYRVNSAWLIGTAALIGLAAHGDVVSSSTGIMSP
jgi:chromate transporter